MALGKKENVQIKKVKPYPFAAQFTKGAQIFTGQVIKLVMHGFMVELGPIVTKVGDLYQVSFILPSEDLPIITQVKVIKTYDKYQAVEAPTKAVRLAEFHFVLPNEELKKKVKHFLKAIKQVGTDLV